MLRFFVFLLLLLNLGYLAWTQKALAVFGLAPESQQEPERLQRQIEPGAIKLYSAQEAANLEAELASAKAKQIAEAEAEARNAGCLQSSPLTLAQQNLIKDSKPSPMSAWPTDAWQLQTVDTPERWMIYMGRFANEAAIAKKEGELRQLGIDFTRMSEAKFSLGLSLGQFVSQAQAIEALGALSRRGVRSAKAMQLNPASTAQVLRLMGVNAALNEKIKAWPAPLQGIDLQTCSDKKPNPQP
jgi:hypothetical protein